MCKHSRDTIDRLAERQRGLDARGNDPLATRRESSWAAEFVQDPPGTLLADTLQYMATLPDQIGDKQIFGMPGFKQTLAQLPPTPTGLQFTEFLFEANPFKKVMDEVGPKVGDIRPDLRDKGRDAPFFVDRGRNDRLPRERRQSFSNPDMGIATGSDRTPDTRNLFTQNIDHAKGRIRGFLDSETFQRFQQSGAPFIGGASGTIQYMTMELESRKPLKKLDRTELQEREKLLAMMSAQLVAAGHHSMTECLIAAKTYGYFKDVPDPLIDYDAAMKALEKHFQRLGLGGGARPLSRDTENQGKSKEQIAYEDRRSYVKSLQARYLDQLPQQVAQNASQALTDAAQQATGGDYGSALASLGRAESFIRGHVSLLDANARGNNNVLRPEQLVEKMGAPPQTGKKKRKGDSAEYIAVQNALGAYQTTMKELGRRKLDHDHAGMAFEELRAGLAIAKQAAQDYIDTYQNDPNATARCGVMTDLIDQLEAEKQLLNRVEGDPNTLPLLGSLSFEQAIEYARFDVKLGVQAHPDVLSESRVTGRQPFGSGGLNSVTLVDYKNDGTHPAEQRVFKPEKLREPRLATPLVQLGIDPENPRAGKRNIASKKMATASGLGAMIPDAEFTTLDGQLGLAMQKATGGGLLKKVPVPVPNWQTNDLLQEAIQAKNGGDPDWKRKIPEKNRSGQRLGYDDQNQTFTVEETRVRMLPLEAPPADAKQVAAMQQQLTNLQWLDALCGQVDRHGENYIVDTSGGTPTVMGIDNDFSFAKNHRDPMQHLDRNALGFPPVIDETTFNNLRAMVQNWSQIEASLKDELTTQEIAATKDRFDAVQKKLDELEQNGMIVKNWQEQIGGRSVTDILMDEKSPASYYRRDVKTQREMVKFKLVAN